MHMGPIKMFLSGTHIYVESETAQISTKNILSEIIRTQENRSENKSLLELLLKDIDEGD